MRSARFGGWLIVGGGVVVAIAIAMYLDGEGLGFGSGDLNGLVLDASLALFAAGAIGLAVAGPEPLDGRLVRVGLGGLAVGQLSLLAFSILAAGSASAPLENPPSFLLLELAGVTAAGLGTLLAGLALIRTPGPARAVGALLLAGILLLAVSAITADLLRLGLPGHTILWALVLTIAGNVGVGLLAIAGRRATPVPSAR